MGWPSLRLKALLLFFPVLCFAQVNKDGDFQIWNRYFMYKHLSPDWTLQLYNEYRFGDTASKLFFTVLQLQFKYQICSWLSASPGYRQVYRRVPANSDNWKPEYSPMLDVGFRYRAAGWDLQDRNRVQYRITSFNPYPWLYRNRLRLVAPPLITDPNFAIYADNEVFWEQANGIGEDRVTAGFMLQFNSGTGGEIFYMARFIKAVPDWIQTNILGLSLIFSW